jgi:hypothetical protein
VPGMHRGWSARLSPFVDEKNCYPRCLRRPHIGRVRSRTRVVSRPNRTRGAERRPLPPVSDRRDREARNPPAGITTGSREGPRKARLTAAKVSPDAAQGKPRDPVPVTVRAPCVRMDRVSRLRFAQVRGGRAKRRRGGRFDERPIRTTRLAFERAPATPCRPEARRAKPDREGKESSHGFETRGRSFNNPERNRSRERRSASCLNATFKHARCRPVRGACRHQPPVRPARAPPETPAPAP